MTSNFQCWHRFGTGNCNLHTGAKSEPNRHQISDVGIEHFLAPVNSSGVGIDLAPHSLWVLHFILWPNDIDFRDLSVSYTAIILQSAMCKFMGRL